MNCCQGIRISAAAIVAWLLLPGWLTGCSGAYRHPDSPVSRSFHAMGTTVTVSVNRQRSGDLPGLVRLTRRIISDIESRISVFVPTSEISSLNRAAGITRIPLSARTYHLLVLARKYGRMTGGAFDITVAPAAALWGLHGKVPLAAPAADVAKASLSGGGWENVELTNQAAFLRTPYTRVDLGGIGIGYAVDLAVVAAREEGYRSFFIRIGNHARGLGWPREHEDWRVPVPDPFLPHLDLAELDIPSRAALAWSVQGLHVPRIGGVAAGPVLDPRSGMPVENTALCAVWASTTTRADALSTAFSVLGPAGTCAVLDRFNDCEILMVEKSLPPRFWATGGAGKLIHWKSRRPAEVIPLRPPGGQVTGRAAGQLTSLPSPD